MKRTKNPNQKAFKIVTKKQIVIAKPVEEPIPEIDTAKAVAFAMSIAQEMKQRQRQLDDARKSETTIVFKKRNVKYSDADLESFRKKLLTARAEIAEKSSSVKDTIGLNAADDIEPDGGDGWTSPCASTHSRTSRSPAGRSTTSTRRSPASPTVPTASA